MGDFTLSLISRVYLEKVNGEYQGACFVFREGFESAVLRMVFGKDGSMLVGMTNRGWNSLGTRSYGLQRLVWSGKTPFEIKTFEARPDGFELSFTKKVDTDTAEAPSSYRLSSYTYYYHQTYGSPEIDIKPLPVRSATVAPDGLRATSQNRRSPRRLCTRASRRRPQVSRRRRTAAPSGLLHAERDPEVNEQIRSFVLGVDGAFSK